MHVLIVVPALGTLFGGRVFEVPLTLFIEADFGFLVRLGAQDEKAEDEDHKNRKDQAEDKNGGMNLLSWSPR